MEFKQLHQLASRAAMEAERIRLFAKIPISAPIDPIETAIKCGCEVRFMNLSSLEGVYSPEPRPTIILGSDRPAGRRSYNCAHELGHHIFKHGMRMDELKEKKQLRSKSPEEFLADAFAGFLLMSQTVVLRALKDRGLDAAILTPDQVYLLANYFGVGYSTVINQLAISLKLITRDHSDNLLKVQPKNIKAQYDTSPNSEAIIVDKAWLYRPVDLEVGDTVILPSSSEVEKGRQIKFAATNNNSKIYRAVRPGYARACCAERQWAVHIRVSRRKYEGLAQYRFLEESEGE
jgi:Zn-dependent peptidase ImmA (M78 family)